MDDMSWKVLPLFTSHYTIGKSILTLEAPVSREEYCKNYPQSIIQICKDNGLTNLFLVENNFAGFIKALTYCKENNIHLNFGLKMIVCENIHTKNPESLDTEHQVIIFARGDKGYERLLNIYSTGAIEGVYYQPRIDYSLIQKHWKDEDLVLAHPFYDSFLHRNFLYGARCSFPEFTEPFFMIENNDLPFNYLINMAIDNYGKDRKISRLPTKSIFYLDKSYFKSYLTSRCIQERQTLDKPNFDHLSSDQFCFESWKEDIEM